MVDIPRQFHFVFGLGEQDAPFHLMHYLCLESCRRTQAPERIVLHCRHRPYGPWWERIAPHLEIRPVRARALGFEPALHGANAEGRFIVEHGLGYAHEAGFVGLEALIEHGGICADMDSLFVRRYDDALLAHDCVLGEEAPQPNPATGILHPSLCNAVIMARPQAPFLLRWQEMVRQAFDGNWSRHSCQAAGRLWAEDPRRVHVAPPWLFYGFGASVAGVKNLLENDAALPRGTCSLNLWANLWWAEGRTDYSCFHHGLLTESYVRAGATTYARLARPFLDE